MQNTVDFLLIQQPDRAQCGRRTLWGDPSGIVELVLYRVLYVGVQHFHKIIIMGDEVPFLLAKFDSYLVAHCQDSQLKFAQKISLRMFCERFPLTEKKSCAKLRHKPLIVIRSLAVQLGSFTGIKDKTRVCFEPDIINESLLVAHPKGIAEPCQDLIFRFYIILSCSHVPMV